MATLNPDKLGELSKFYWQIPAGNQGLDLSGSDSTLLADANWDVFCIKNLSRSATRDMREIMDRCNPTLKTYSPGRRDKGLSFELNQFRWDITDLKSFHVAIEEGQVFSVLALNDERGQTDTWGWIGNFVVEEFSGEEPEDGLNTESFSMKPAARSLTNPAVRWIYGSSVS
jgi:hypothetical protein